MDKLNEAIEHFGTATELAGKLGVNKMAITNWKKRGVPMTRAIEIEKLSNGQIKASDLCPELNGLSPA